MFIYSLVHLFYKTKYILLVFHFNYLMAQGQIAIAKARWKIITLTNQGLVPILWIIPHHYILVWQRKQHAHSVCNWVLSRSGHLYLCCPEGCSVKLGIGGQWNMSPGAQHNWLTGLLRDGAHCFLWHFKAILFNPGFVLSLYHI